jgi:hypothetical protein
MGLLEKAGQMQDGGASKPAKKSKVAKAKPAKAKPVAKKSPRRAKKVSDDLDDFEVAPRVAKTLPDEYEISKKPARFARSLVDFIVSYGWAAPIVGINLYGSNFDGTYFIIGGALLLIFNVIAMPIMTNRTVGNYASLTKYVTHKGAAPFFLHQTFKALTVLFLSMGAFMILSDGIVTTAGVNTVNLGIGFGILLLPISDWIIAKVRHETKQGLWDSMFFAYMVSHTRSDDAEATGFFGKLESSGDWLKDKGWLGDEKSED